jgi:hypothetical protein
VLLVALSVGAFYGGSHERNSVNVDGWESAVHVAVKGEVPGTCASARPPNAWMLDADQWIVCGSSGRYRCFRQRLHALDFKAQPIRAAPFDDSCRAALAVLREAALVT